MKTTEQETILVTGATGTVGSEVVKQLSSDSTDVIFTIAAAFFISPYA
jgi:FlaA1/EpsC-like NDP-sugar epimerase